MQNVAIAAIAFALGAAATAGADQLITGKDIKNGSISVKDLSAKARKSLRGQRGPQGPPGPSGASGVNGNPGPAGSSGSAGPSLVLGGFGINQGADTFATPTGQQVGTEASAQVPVPSGTALTARDFTVDIAPPVAAGQQLTVVLRLDTGGGPQDTPLACTLTAGQSGCTPPGVLALPPGSKINMKNTASAALNVSTKIGYSFRIVF